MRDFGPTSEEYVKSQEKVANQQEIVNELGAAGIDWVGELSKEFAGSAATAAQTYAGQMAILKERLGEFQESIGAKVLPMMGKLLTMVMDVAKGFSGEDPEGLSNRARELAGNFEGNGANSLGGALRAVADAFSGLFKEINSPDAETGITTLQKMAEAMETFANAIKSVTEAYESYMTFYDKVPGPLKEFMNPFKRLGDYIKLAGGRAAGGSVMANQPYRVGEFGPETFIPSGSGSIRPATDATSGNTFIFNGVIDGESARRSIEKLLQDSARRTGAVNFVGATL